MARWAEGDHVLGAGLNPLQPVTSNPPWVDSFILSRRTLSGL
ncbi:hypothetical protein HALO59_170011 [Halomonas sp. 59]|nr:hypothetical protein HALO156_10380 [Halomonas sp. 156]CAD5263876.1 hypothetical protein HALO113_160847 [Halomonas sp. 113]CAD5266565.1 hypothetical protein HALO59_170011 [Halomonas sp. 59]CAD5278552.1 hypothetical protein HALOI3_210192 [Halomonas sp. I3]VXB55768.1 hypothetical protein HALO98_170193 [Halomonas titanicae]